MSTFGKLSKLKEDPTEETPPPTIKLKSHIREDIPDAYLKGWIEFYKLKFKVTSDVLIPRPETELLVDEVLSSLRGASATKQSFRILDIGTGSGNIAISIAKNSKNARIFAIDISEEALNVAKLNARFHHVEDKIFFLKSDLLSVIPANAGIQKTKSPWIPDQVRDDKIHIIITNLPYIPTSRMPLLDPSVKDFEPRLALDGGPDGFDLYRRLFIQMLEKKLFPKLFIGEIDDSQGDIALQEAKKYFPKAKAEIKLDLAHKQRILIIKY